MNFFDEGRVHARQAGQGSGVWGRVGACHLVRILKAAQRVLLSILFAVCLPPSLPLTLPRCPSRPLYAVGHVNTCRKPFANPRCTHPTQVKLGLASACCCSCWSCKQIAQFFWGFSSAFSFFRLPAAAAAACCLLPGEGYQRIILSKECGCSWKLLRPKEKQPASEKWKMEKPNEKEREKYLLGLLVGCPASRSVRPCFAASKAII